MNFVKYIYGNIYFQNKIKNLGNLGNVKEVLK